MIKPTLELRDDLSKYEKRRAVQHLADVLYSYSKQFDFDNAVYEDAQKVARELMGFPDD